SGNDIEMLMGDTMAVVVGNHSEELNHLKGVNRIYFAEASYAHGILEGMQHYKFGAHAHAAKENEEVPRARAAKKKIHHDVDEKVI
ncbi:MAG TPA: HAD family hydrolase, partial [Methylophilus sp.]|nr:HAD family hydrolase [Methylophilus sp.]